MSKDKFTRAGILAVLIAAGMEKDRAKKMITHVFDSLTAALSAGKVIELRGFGTLEPRERKARIRYNPRTMTPVHVPARRVIFFRPAGSLKKALNGK
jgi:integration host factor subunit beta